MNFKKIGVVLIGMILFLSPCFAQINSGSFLIGGNVGFGLGNEKNSVRVGSITNSTVMSTSNVIVSPRAGFFVLNNFAVGVNLDLSSYSWTQRDGADVEKSRSSRFTAGPFVRYYIPLGEVYPFIEGNINFGAATFKNVDNNVESKTVYNLMDLGVGPGLAVFITDNVAIEALLRFVRSAQTYQVGSTDIKEINTGMAFSVGVQAYILR